jgi:hypothetical protein
MIDKGTKYLRVLIIDASNGFYRINKYPVGAFYGPVDLGIHLAYKHNSLRYKPAGTGSASLHSILIGLAPYDFTKLASPGKIYDMASPY